MLPTGINTLEKGGREEGQGILREEAEEETESLKEEWRVRWVRVSGVCEGLEVRGEPARSSPSSPPLPHGDSCPSSLLQALYTLLSLPDAATRAHPSLIIIRPPCDSLTQSKCQLMAGRGTRGHDPCILPFIFCFGLVISLASLSLSFACCCSCLYVCFFTLLCSPHVDCLCVSQC